MKKISFAIACIAVLTSFVGSAAAQQLVKADVPFAFSVHEKTFPAGVYEMRYLGNSFVRLQDIKTGSGVTLFAPSAIRDSSGMTWTFRQYGEQRFLGSFADPRLKYAASVPVSNSERQLRNTQKVATTIALRASK